MKEYRGNPIFTQYSHLLLNHIAGNGWLAWCMEFFSIKYNPFCNVDLHSYSNKEPMFTK